MTGVYSNANHSLLQVGVVAIRGCTGLPVGKNKQYKSWGYG
jgi:hypothetical protein